MTRYHNKTYTQPIRGEDYKAPSEVVNAIKAKGMYITSGNNGKTVSVHKIVNGKDTYVGTLASFVKESASYMYRTNDTRNVTLGNLKSM